MSFNDYETISFYTLVGMDLDSKEIYLKDNNSTSDELITFQYDTLDDYPTPKQDLPNIPPITK